MPITTPFIHPPISRIWDVHPLTLWFSTCSLLLHPPVTPYTVLHPAYTLVTAPLNQTSTGAGFWDVHPLNVISKLEHGHFSKMNTRSKFLLYTHLSRYLDESNSGGESNPALPLNKIGAWPLELFRWMIMWSELACIWYRTILKSSPFSGDVFFF